MLPPNTYTSGEFAKRSNVSLRTIRYYDEIGLLKPTHISDSGYRLYTDPDFVTLQKIIVLKNLGFSLEDISWMIRSETDQISLVDSFQVQLDLIRNKMNELKQMEQSLLASKQLLTESDQPDWNRLIPLLHLMNMQETLTEQYRNSKNTEIRIHLHQKYAQNTQGWYPWIYSLAGIQPKANILDLGCGNGQLWHDNTALLPDNCRVLLNDCSDGMLNQAKESIDAVFGDHSGQFTYHCFDCNTIPYPDHSFDVVFANHLLFYVKDLSLCLSEIQRVLKPGGSFCCTTYGQSHMKEIDHLVKEFDRKIALSEINLYDIFGLEHGSSQLEQHFESVQLFRYPDRLLVTDARDLLDYIYSCHGNQMECLKDRTEQFERFIQKKVGRRGLSITKDAGLFRCC